MADASFTPANVIAVGFADDSHAYDALTRLKELASQGQIELDTAVVVVRDEDGKIVPKAELGDGQWDGTASGGILGLVVGILGGPLGVLLGGATGMLIGSLFDEDDADETKSVLAAIGRSVERGRTSLIAQVLEQTPEVIDTAMERLGGTVVRRPLQDVQAEVAATEQAQREAASKARQALREARHDVNQEKVHAKIAELKAKLPGRKEAEPAR